MIGDNGFENMTWFMGLVEDINDPHGGRVRVRAFGFHPADPTLVRTEDLPWAMVLRPGSGRFYGMPEEGDMVMGFFMDGRDAQHPVVVGIVNTAKNTLPNGSAANSDTGSPSVEGVPQQNPNPPTPTSESDVVKIIETGPGYNRVQLADGTIIRQEGDRNWRNNNPGNIEYGSFAISQGAIGSDGRFAIFPNDEMGRKAKENLLFSTSSYSGKTIAGAISRYAPSFENDVGAYSGFIASKVGVSPNTPLSSLSPTQREAMLDAMAQFEGYRVGSTTIESGVNIADAQNPYIAPSQDAVNNYGNPQNPWQISGEQIEKSPLVTTATMRKTVAFGDYVVDEPNRPASPGVRNQVWQTRFGGSHIELGGSTSDSEYVSVTHNSGSHVSLDANGNITIKAMGRVFIGSEADMEEVIDGKKLGVYNGGYGILVTDGKCIIQSTGDLDISTQGNLNIGVAGKMTVTTGKSIDMLSPRVALTAKTDNIDLVAAGKIKVDAKGTLNLKSGMATNIQAVDGSLNLKSDGSVVTIQADGSLGLKAGGNIMASGSNIHLNSPSNAAPNAGAAEAGVAAAAPDAPSEAITNEMDNNSVPPQIDSSMPDGTFA